jgi:valyl-tRNA synthetase
VSTWPEGGKVDEALLQQFEVTREVVSNIRKIRKEKNIPFKEKIDFIVRKGKDNDQRFDASIIQLCNLNTIEYSSDTVENAFSFVIKNNEYFIPFSENIDVESEIKKVKEELEYTRGFLNSVKKKLENKRFVENAPAKVVEMENSKKEDAERKIEILEKKLISLS